MLTVAVTCGFTAGCADLLVPINSSIFCLAAAISAAVGIYVLEFCVAVDASIDCRPAPIGEISPVFVYNEKLPVGVVLTGVGVAETF